MAEEIQTSNQDVQTDNQDSSNQDVKTVTPNSSNDVKNQQVEDEKPKVPMKNFGGYEIPEEVYKELTKNSFTEGWRKAEKQFSEDGKLRTEEDLQKIKQYEQYAEIFGNTLKPGEKLTPDQVNDLLNTRISEKTEVLNERIKALNQKFEKESDEKEQLIENIKMNKIKENIKNALASHPNVDKEMFSDLTTLILLDNRLKIDDTDESFSTIQVLSQSGERSFNKETGEPLSVQDYVHTWLNGKPQYLKAPDKGGAGSRPGAGSTHGSGHFGHPVLDRVASRNHTRGVKLHGSGTTVTANKPK